MKVALTGAGGFIGSALHRLLRDRGCGVTRLARNRDSLAPNCIYWNPQEGIIDATGLEGLDAVIHLAGESLGSGRWTPDLMKRFRDSRVVGTRLLSESLAELQQPPKVLLCASGIGYYGDRGEETLTEQSSPGEGFLTKLCLEWEAAAEAARSRGIRVAHLRIGFVLSPTGGGLKAMLPIFKLGLGGKLGSGRQYMSWITLPDVLEAVYHCLSNEGLFDGVNLVAPTPVTNASFTKCLGKTLKRPAFLTVPPFVLKLMFGAMAPEAIFASQRVHPKKLLDSGFTFLHSDIDSALAGVLKAG